MFFRRTRDSQPRSEALPFAGRRAPHRRVRHFLPLLLLLLRLLLRLRRRRHCGTARR
jgi:hypothetical protein